MMLNAELVSTGTELLLGQTLNTNAQFLAERLAGLGIYCYYQTTVGDNPDRVRQVVEKALTRTDLVITTGGLGPTMDDLTKEVVADLLGIPLVLHPDLLAGIEAFFSQRGRQMPENNKKQAMLPVGAIPVPNKFGTAPGLIVEKGNKTVVMLPGPPFEMRPMFDESVISYLAARRQQSPGVLCSRVLKVIGPGESVIENRLQDLITGQTNPTLALLARDEELHIRLTARAAAVEVAAEIIQAYETEIRQRLYPYVYGVDNETMGSVVGQLLLRNGWQLAVAESCTGGLIGDLLTNVPGASAYFSLGVTTYSNQAKMGILGIDQGLLRDYGAVSPQTAAAMARAVRQLAGAEIGLSVTGIAGPDGGTREKPVGLAYLSYADGSGEVVKEIRQFGDRVTIKLKTAYAALNWLRLRLAGQDRQA
ncbi:MAG: competence/damage-inducible protein A [Heliobacteriaceae bacterium]|nr:competence/damage-inducible protein A [Heliobacteriaceae bacterium]MDD4587881.1 competence/damage-inducible protein A [Heliobacteriaceae bacterium]